jgi:hypothetical protein
MSTFEMIPGSHEIAGALQRWTGRGSAPASLLLPGIGIFAAGMLAGAAVAILFTPKPGAELRREIGSRVGRLRDGMRSKIPEGVAVDGGAAA